MPKLNESRYDEEEAKVYLKYAMATFCKRQKIEQWSCGAPCDGAPTLANKVKFLAPGTSNVQGYVAMVPYRNSSLCLTAFRGSVNPKNWLDDLKFWSSSWPPAEWGGEVHNCVNCEVHTGFADAYAELRDQVNNAFDTLSCQDFAFVGHSLGAGVATLAAMDARMHGRKVSKVYTFGSPLVGNAAFATTFNQLAEDEGIDPPSWRLVHRNDWVPHLQGPFEGFHHVDREVFYIRGSDGRDIVCREGMEDPRCSASVKRIRLFGSDHGSYLGESMRVQDMPEQCTGKPPMGLTS
jgi:pimeloyl-ACP methyl ester carboxylesterase